MTVMEFVISRIIFCLCIFLLFYPGMFLLLICIASSKLGSRKKCSLEGKGFRLMAETPSESLGKMH